jgi:hypothetical protein
MTLSCSHIEAFIWISFSVVATCLVLDHLGRVRRYKRIRKKMIAEQLKRRS